MGTPLAPSHLPGAMHRTARPPPSQQRAATRHTPATQPHANNATAKGTAAEIKQGRQSQ